MRRVRKNAYSRSCDGAAERLVAATDHPTTTDQRSVDEQTQCSAVQSSLVRLLLHHLSAQTLLFASTTVGFDLAAKECVRSVRKDQQKRTRSVSQPKSDSCFGFNFASMVALLQTLANPFGSCDRSGLFRNWAPPTSVSTFPFLYICILLRARRIERKEQVERREETKRL